MAKVMPESAQVNARILYWGIAGAGKRTSLEVVATRLRPDHRGELSETPTRFDPSVSYTMLPIELGDVAGIRTRIELVAVPGEPDHAPTRKQLLDEVDGVVLVIDSQESRIDENAAIVEELRKSVGDYARRLDELPLVVQYNKRDLSNAYVIDELHRRLRLGNATVFETVATDATGVLQALSTISKKVIRALRGESIPAHRPAAPAPPPAAPARSPAPARRAPPPVQPAEEDAFAFGTSARQASPSTRLEEAILAEADGADGGEALASAEAARSLLEQPWHEPGDVPAPALGVRLSTDLSIVSVGEATRVDDRSVRIPLVLGDGDGGTGTLVLTIRLDPLLEES
jgi:signal recognition particle receptor subunit beta